LEDNQIEDYAGLEEHLHNLIRQQRESAHKYNPIHKKLKDLSYQMKQYESYKKHKEKYEKYQQEYKNQLPWKKKAFEAKHYNIISNYEVSKRYIDHFRNDKKQIPINAWKKEYAELSTELQKLDRQYKNLKSEVDKISKIRINVYNILYKENQREQPIYTHNAER